MANIEVVSFERPWKKAEIHNAYEDDGARIAVAEAWGTTIIGFLVYGKFSIAFNDDEEPAKICQLIDLAVLKENRRRKIGSRLVEFAEREYHSLPKVAQVVETNLDAQLFFREIGYKCVETWHPDPGSGEGADDFYVMKKAGGK